MNPTAGTSKTESVTLSCLQMTAEHSQWSQHDPTHSRHLAAQMVFLDIIETLGTTFVPDLFAALERTPAYPEVAWELFKNEVDLEALDARTKHIVALAITTNRSGTYQIAAFPHAFRLSPVGPRRCETILSLIGMFRAFSQYLSDVVLLRNETNELGHGFT